jgi:hypothetical protein
MTKNISKFDSDLSDGKWAENVICNICRRSGFLDTVLHETDKLNSFGKPTAEGLVELRRFDVCNSVFTVEVKNDIASADWNRAFIELFCNDKPSGLNTTSADLWVQFYYGEETEGISMAGVWVCNTNTLRNRVIHDKFTSAMQITSCGDNGASQGFAFYPKWLQQVFFQLARYDSNGILEFHNGTVTRYMLEVALSQQEWRDSSVIPMT